MDRLKHTWFHKVPAAVRRPVILVLGSLFIIASVLTGWLPGPGGIPLFLIGIAILATEFEQARKFRDIALGYLERFGAWYRKNRLLGTILLVVFAAAALTVGYFSFQSLR